MIFLYLQMKVLISFFILFQIYSSMRSALFGRKLIAYCDTAGYMLSGFMNPLFYLFDWDDMEKGNLYVRHKIPYSDVETYGFARLQEENRPAEFGHSLTDQLAGQLDAGFAIIGLYEDSHTDLKISRIHIHLHCHTGSETVKGATNENIDRRRYGRHYRCCPLGPGQSRTILNIHAFAN